MEKQSLSHLRREKVSAIKPQQEEQECCTHLTLKRCFCVRPFSIVNKVCTHLSLGIMCPCCSSTSETRQPMTVSVLDSPSSTKNNPTTNKNKRKLCDINNAPSMVAPRKKIGSCLKNKAEREGEKGRTWECSTALVLYEDPWKIKKVLEKSDLGNMSRLLLPKGLAEDLVVSVLGEDARRNVESDRGIEVSVWDLDTESAHKLVFKRWGSSRSYVFIGNWVKDFVIRRGLLRGDQVGFHWDPFNNHFNFSLLLKAKAKEDHNN